MKRITGLSRRAALVGAMACLAASPLMAQDQNIAGSYLAEGRNPDGSPYSGTVVISQDASAVQMNWTVGNQTYAGSGILSNQVLVVNWGQPQPVIYVVMQNGELHGTWAGGRALERLVPQR